MGLQGSLLLSLGGLCGGGVLPELLQPCLSERQSVLLGAVSQPRLRCLDPLQQLQFRREGEKPKRGDVKREMVKGF